MENISLSKVFPLIVVRVRSISEAQLAPGSQTFIEEVSHVPLVLVDSVTFVGIIRVPKRRNT